MGSKFLQLLNKMIICFDIGGTKTRVAASRDGREFISNPIIFDTPQKFTDGIEKITETATTLSAGEKIAFISGGIAGQLDSEKAKLRGSRNLPDWVDQPLKKTLEERLDSTVRLENDAALAALGEALNGAGRDKRIVAYLTIGTGFGGARVVEGKIDDNSLGFEPGGSILEFGETAQKLVSGKALAERLGKNPEEIKDEAIWNNLAEKVAIAVNNAIIFWSPDALILGGSMMIGDPAIPIDRVREKVLEILKIFPQIPEIALAGLGDYSTLYGALLNIKNKSAP